MTLSERFWSKVEKTEGGCWIWKACKTNGYGMYSIARSVARLAHRLSYESVHGSIPEGLCLDHLCRNRACVNPDHLEPVTIGENVMRGKTIASNNQSKEICKRGHVFDRVIVRKSNGRTKRFCNKCATENRRLSNQKRRDLIRA